MLTIVLALDGSPAGEKAALALSRWAESIPITVHLFSVLRPSEGGAVAGSGRSSGSAPVGEIAADQFGDVRVSAEGPPAHGSESRDQALSRARAEREDYLRDLGGRLFKGDHPPVHVDFSDDVPAAVLACAAKVGAGAIAMGTHGRSGVRQILVGSVAQAVVRESTLPVILIGPHGEPQAAH